MSAYSFQRLWGYVVVVIDIIFQKFRSFRWGPIDSVGDFSVEGKTILITGPTSGIGKSTSWALVKRKAHVVLACRDVSKGEKMKTEFESEAQELGLPPPSIDVVQLDVSDFKSVERLVSEWRSTERPLHILINNAGIFDIGGHRRANINNMEQHMVTNHLGPFLLTLGLLPCLRKAARGGHDCRIINVVSVMHHVAQMDLRDPFLANPGEFSADRAYAQSKLSMILFGAELQRRLREDEGITVCSVHPGEAVTDVARGIPRPLFWIYKKILPAFLFTAEEGARASVYCATAKEVPVESRAHIGYFGSNGKPERPSSMACSKEFALEIWKWSASMTDLPREWDLPEKE